MLSRTQKLSLEILFLLIPVALLAACGKMTGSSTAASTSSVTSSSTGTGTSPSQPGSTVNAAQFGISTSASDNHKLLQDAMNQLAAQGGGQLQISPGIYNFTDVLTIPEGVVLSGVTPGPFDPAGIGQGHSPADTQTGGATFVINTASALPFITLAGNNGGVENILFYYVNQAAPEASAPIALPATIQVNGAGNRVTACSFTNSYVGVVVQAGRTRLDSLNIGAFQTGVLVDGPEDFVTITNTFVEPFWDTWTGRLGEFPAALDNWVFNNGYAITLGRVDGIDIEGVSAFYRYAGLLLTQTPSGVAWGSITNFKMDSGKFGVLSYATNIIVGISIVNSDFLASANGQSQAAIALMVPTNGNSSLINLSGGSITNGYATQVSVAPKAGILEITGVANIANQTLAP